MSDSVPAVLKRKMDIIIKNTEALAAKTRDWQLIKQYLANRLDDIELTDIQKDKLERYQFIYNQSVSGKYTESDIVRTVMRTYNVRIAQAYEDISSTKELFNTVLNLNKQFELKVQLEANRVYQIKANAMGDMKALASLEKNRILLVSQIPEKEDNPAENFEGHQLEAVFNPRLIGADPIDIMEMMKVINENRNVPLKIEQFAHLAFEDIPNERERTDSL